jgi:hypothetical protein
MLASSGAKGSFIESESEKRGILGASLGPLSNSLKFERLERFSVSKVGLVLTPLYGLSLGIDLTALATPAIEAPWGKEAGWTCILIMET